MLIDWFTVTAQVINFLILAYLLKRFLYGPIIRAMDEREKKIAMNLERAEKKKDEASREAESYRLKNRRFDEHRKEMLLRINEEAKTFRNDLTSKVRNQVDADRIMWYEAIRKEKDVFLHDLRRRTGKQTCAIARRVLKDMANVDIENQIIHVFIKKLRGLNKDEIEALRESIHQSPQKISVRSAFKITEEMAEEIKKALQNQVADHVNVQFKISQDIICGIELKFSGRKISWNVADYLEILEENLLATLENKVINAEKLTLKN